jgi:benzoate transport
VGGISVTAEGLRNLVQENTRPSTRRAIVTICLLVTIIDGFDILAIAFVAPIVAHQWRIDPIQLGVVFSSGLAGMAVGAFALSPLGDILGRRAAIVINLLLIGSGMLLTAAAYDVPTLAVSRFLTGLGIGAMLSSTGTIIVEYVPLSKRTMALGLMFIGNPIGNLISGLVALAAIEVAGWQAVFLFGGVFTLVMIVPVLWGIPESVEFLLRRRPKSALPRLNAALVRIGLPTVSELPTSVRPMTKVGFFDVVRGTLLGRTILIGAIQFIFMFAYYIFVNWSPKMITEMGSSVQAGVLIAMLINVGGIAGPIVVGLITPRFGLFRTTVYGFLAFGICLVCFGAAPQFLWVLGLIALVAGFSIFATEVPLYALVAGSYPAEIRVTAVGIVFAIGRIGSVLGPSIAGVLLAEGFGRFGLFLIAALPMLLAAAMIRRIPYREGSETPSDELARI